MPAANGSAAPFQPYLSEIGQKAVFNPIRKVVAKLNEHPDAISLSGGRPPMEVFPDTVKGWEDENLMNYGPAHGVGGAEMKKWSKEFVAKYHSPPGGFEHREVHATSGNTDGITKAVMLLADPGDIVLAEEVSYPGITASAVPLGRRVLGVAMDLDGMIPGQLEATIANLKESDRTRIRFLYLTPHGGNPTGITMPEERKDAIYALARKHNLVILEDDPYFFLQISTREPGLPIEEQNMVGAQAFPRSFLSRDVDGRVVRLDSLSKTIAPGYRLGWATGPKSLMIKWQMLAMCFSWSVSGVTQRAFMDLAKQLGDDGLHAHLQRAQCVYARRCGYLVKACETHLSDLCRWAIPQFGMFLWLEIPGCEDTESMAEELIASYGVGMVPGGSFLVPEGASRAPRSFFRVSFTLLTEEETADKAMSQLRKFLLKSGRRSDSELQRENSARKRSAEGREIGSPPAKK